MKKYIFLLVFSFCFVPSQAQDINDALRYSQSNIDGTARFRAMGGAFAALGGDLSAISINPASSVIFNNNQVGFTMNSYNSKNNSEFFGSESNNRKSTINLNQAGVVFVFQNHDQENDWKKFAIAVNYDNVSNFNNRVRSRGVNSENSIGDYFVNQANGIPLNMLEVGGGYSPEGWYNNLGGYINGAQLQTAFLGYETFVTGANGTGYYSNVPQGVYDQNSYVNQTGYNGKIAFNFATQYTDRFHFGINLNAHVVNYTKRNTFMEVNSNPINNAGDEIVRDIYYETDLYTYGGGFSLQLGGIIKVTDGLRLGLSYESPTWYRLNDEMTQYISVFRETDVVNPNGELIEGYFYSPNIQIYPEYKLQTPSKYTVGAAYVFGNIGLISVDYSMKDYSSTKLKPNNAFYDSQNTLMSSVLDVTSELRVGAEAKIKQWSLRAGYNYEQSPFKNGNTIGDLQQYSAGFGYNFGATKLDLAYSRSQREFNQALFHTGLTNAPKIETITNNVFLTLLFEF